MLKLLSKSLLFAMSIVAVGLFVQETRADDLFSRVSTISVFDESGSAISSREHLESSERGRRIGTVGQLADMLRDAGLDPEADGQRVVNVKLQHAKWTFPIALGINESGDQIRLALTLSQFDSGKQPTSSQLLALLEANREHQPAFFSFSEKRRQIELFLSIPNEQVTTRQLREELRRAATIAQCTASLWDINSSANSTTAAPTTTTGSAVNSTTAAPATKAAPPQVTQVAGGSLVGKWSAARSNTQAFAMQFKADGTFILVTVIDSKQSKASGKFTLIGGLLTLTTDSGTSSANVANLSASSFDFTPPGKATAKLTFKRAG
ncbi:MAG: hypothetical protein IT427_06205 [Pirellulales bacterium]|nr:hypothetical protein [Pirellulales bacterium]